MDEPGLRDRDHGGSRGYLQPLAYSKETLFSPSLYTTIYFFLGGAIIATGVLIANDPSGLGTEERWAVPMAVVLIAGGVLAIAFATYLTVRGIIRWRRERGRIPLLPGFE